MVTLLGRDLGACATPGKKTAIGAGGGAAVGAGIGALAGGGKGALIGAAIRGLTGGAIGNYLDKQEEELRQVAEARRTQNGILVNLKSSLLFFVAVGYPAWRTVAFTCVGLVGYGLYVLSRLPGSRLPRWGGRRLLARVLLRVRRVQRRDPLPDHRRRPRTLDPDRPDRRRGARSGG